MNAQDNTRLQVMWNRLLAIVEEQGQTLIRAAFSPLVRECGDISAGIFDLQGRMLAQAVTGTPGHINTMAEAVKTLRARFPLQEMKPGDIFLTNDPWIASGHLNDFLLMMPAFLDDRLVGFTACTSHLADLGGMGNTADGSDVYDEGLLVPPCHLADAGQVNEFLLTMIRANSREPVTNEGDIYALMACCEAGVDRLVSMMREFGIDHLDDLSRYIIETSRRGTIEAIAEVPPGVYENTLKVDGYEDEMTLAATMTVKPDGIHLDFAGTSGYSKKGINVPLNYATAYSVFGMRCIIGPDIPNNAGSLEPFTVSGPEDCILNAQPPAPVAMRHSLGQMTPDLVYGCLHQAIPERVPAEGASCMYDLTIRNMPEAAYGDGQIFALELVHNGGTGARPNKDGLSVTSFPSGVWGSLVETTESVAPVRYLRRELRPDSGGAGAHRGGLGQRIEMETTTRNGVLISVNVERVKNPAAGRGGGHNGAAGRIRIDDGKDLPSKGTMHLVPGQCLYFDTPGGGGIGNPASRDRAAVAKDLSAGLINETTARDVYGLTTDRDET